MAPLTKRTLLRSRGTCSVSVSVLICACLALCGCGTGVSTPAQAPALSLTGNRQEMGRLHVAHGASGGAPSRFFSSSSFWYARAAREPVDPTSAAVVSAFDGLIAEEQRAKTGPWINTTKFSVPVYTVGANQPTVTVRLEHHAPEPVLQAAWKNVPLPASAQPARGHDELLVVWQPSTERLWEFWHLWHGAAGWQATWGGAMRHVSSDRGVYGPEAWPGAKTWWGASASSLSLVGGLITLEDLERGVINHALSMSIPGVRTGVYASPAQRSDGTDPSPLSLPEGAHLRLDPSLDLTSLHLPHLTLMIAEAAQRYGIFVRDGSAFVTFQAQDPIGTNSEPYAGPGGYFAGLNPREILAGFPWDKLELLKMELHASARNGSSRQLG
jgi:hypothetical protein